MGDDIRSRTLYYLIHATKHIRRAMIMKAVMVASSTPGLLGFGGARRHRQSPLFQDDIDRLPQQLLTMFAGQTLTFEDIIARSIEQTGVCTETNYRACLKQLESHKRVTVTRITSKRSGLSKEDRVSFPGP